jgi:hypothetical protein
MRTPTTRQRSKRVLSITTIAFIVMAIGLAFVVVQPVLTARAATQLEYFKPVKATLAAGQRVEYTFNGKKGDKITITMAVTDGDVNPYLSLYDPQGTLIGENDNGAGKDNAMLSGIVLALDGTFKIVAVNVNASGAGEYSLIVLRESVKGVIYYDGKPNSDKQAYQLSRPWGHTNITYRIMNTLPGFDASAVRQIIAQGFGVWAQATPLKFTEVSGNADINIQFNRIDGPLSVLGEACPPSSPCAGEITFDSEEPWVLGAPQSEQDISFLGVASHEFGHAIGLLHSNDSSALMYYAYSPYNVQPNADDIAGIQRLYGSGQGSVNNAPSAPPSTGANGQPQVTGTINDQSYVNFWDFDVQAGEAVTITMQKQSGNLDSFLVLLDANNHILAYDDDSGGRREAQLRNVTLPQSGTYTIAATRAEQAQGHTQGNYVLTIDYGGTTGGNTGPVATVPPASSGQTGAVKVSKGDASVLGQGQSLDSVADSGFADSVTPITQTRNAIVQANQTYVWSVTWCASDANTLQKNIPNIAVSFAVNDRPVDPGLITQVQHNIQNLSCIDYFVLLSNWQPGQVSLTRTMTLKAPTFDGNAIYGAGNYLYKYNVTAQ